LGLRVLSFLHSHFCPLFLSRGTEASVNMSMDSPSIHLSAPRGSITFRFLVQLKNAYLCKGEQHQLLYCIMVVKMKADLRLFSGVGRIGFNSV